MSREGESRVEQSRVTLLWPTIIIIIIVLINEKKKISLEAAFGAEKRKTNGHKPDK